MATVQRRPYYSKVRDIPGRMPPKKDPQVGNRRHRWFLADQDPMHEPPGIMS